MFYSHEEISMMSKSHIEDIRESCKRNYRKEKMEKNKKLLLNVVLISKVFTFLKLK